MPASFLLTGVDAGVRGAVASFINAYVAQMVRAVGSYPTGQWFDSTRRYHVVSSLYKPGARFGKLTRFIWV